MKENIDKLVRLLDRALIVAKKELAQHQTSDSALIPIKSAERTVENISKIRGNILTGKISSSHGGTLGLSQNIGEWCDNEELLDLAFQIDKYFKENF
jgi:hypothetical protein